MNNCACACDVVVQQWHRWRPRQVCLQSHLCHSVCRCRCPSVVRRQRTDSWTTRSISRRCRRRRRLQCRAQDRQRAHADRPASSLHRLPPPQQQRRPPCRSRSLSSHRPRQPSYLQLSYHPESYFQASTQRPPGVVVVEVSDQQCGVSRLCLRRRQTSSAWVHSAPSPSRPLSPVSNNLIYWLIPHGFQPAVP